MIKDFNVGEKTIQFLEEDTGKKLHDIGLDNDLLDDIQKQRQQDKS